MHQCSWVCCNPYKFQDTVNEEIPGLQGLSQIGRYCKIGKGIDAENQAHCTRTYTSAFCNCMYQPRFALRPSHKYLNLAHMIHT